MNNIQQKKLKMWQDKLRKMEEEYALLMQKRGEAMAMGDLRENAAFQMLDEDASTCRIKIEEVKKIIEVIKNGSSKN